MTIRHLKIFTVVVEKGTMSAAAESLFITQPSISQAIRELEEHYETLLFERLSKKLHITEAGKLLYRYAKQVIFQFDLMEENMSKKTQRQKLRLGATLTIGSSILSPLVRDFRAKMPDTKLYSYVGNTHDIEEKILDMELDVGIIEGQVKNHDLITIPLVKDCLVLACSKEHPFSKEKLLSVSQLQGQEFVIREKGSGTRELFEKYLHKHKVTIQVVFEENSPDAIRRAALINNCLTVISPRLLENEIQNKEVSVFTEAANEWNRYFSFVYHKDKFLTPSILFLQDLIAKYGEHEVLKDIPAGIIAP